MREDGGVRLCGLGEECGDGGGEVLLSRPHEAVAAHVEPLLAQPFHGGWAGLAVLFPHRPFEVILDHDLVEVFDDDGAVAVGIRAGGEELACIDGTAPGEGVALHLHMHLGVRDGLAAARDRDGEVALAELLDARGGGGAPRCVGLASAIGGGDVRQGFGGDCAAVVQELEAREGSLPLAKAV